MKGSFLLNLSVSEGQPLATVALRAGTTRRCDDHDVNALATTERRGISEESVTANSAETAVTAAVE